MSRVLLINLFITLAVGERQDILNITDTLRENIFYLISFELFVKSSSESVRSLS